MNPKWMIGLLMLFGTFTVLSGIIEQAYLGSAETGVFQDLLQPDLPTLNWWNLPVIAVTLTWDIVLALWTAFLSDYAFLTGDWVIVKIVIFWPISVGLIVSLVLAAIRGVSS